ncbi:TPA: hypothetical protein ACGEYZ_005176 [Klebsiella pneumoniae]
MTSKLNINWLNKCRCGNRMHTVETVRGSHVRLFEDDAVKCNSCGREGVIQTCDGIATVLWETDAERAEGAAMTKSTITRERLEALAVEDDLYNYPPTQDELNTLARMALAAMDSEPHTDDELSNLLWYSQEATCHSDPNYFCEFQRLATPGFIASIILELQERRKAAMDSEPVAWMHSNNDIGIPAITVSQKIGHYWMAEFENVQPLYRHAQPAPVVPPMQHWEELCRQYPDMSIRDAIIRAAWWNHCRAAMLQAGNSPVIPDGYVMVPKEPTQAMCAAFNDSDYGRKSLRERYVAMLAAAPQEVK